MTITNKVSLKSVNGGNTPIADVPDAPTIGAATNVGTSRAYNNGSATVAYTAAATGGAVTTFTATSTPGSFTATGASPITVTGLQSATSYTFAVSAANANGTLTSAASSSITATTVPNAPTIGTFTDGGTGTTGTLSFTAPATGGSAITGYKYSTDGTTYSSASGTTSPLSLTGLTAGTYNFSLKATNTNGDSLASGNASGTVITPSSFESIATVTGTGSSATITFSSIPSNYKHLQIRYLSRGTSDNVMYLRINSDSGTNYSDHALYGGGTSAASLSDVSNTRIAQFRQSDSATTAQMGVGIIDIDDYASTTKNKIVRALTGYDANGSGIVMLTSGQRINTEAITTLTFNVDGGFFSSNSVFSLYGIKG